MAKRSPSGTPQRRTASTRPNRATEKTKNDIQEHNDSAADAPATTSALVRYLTDPAIEEAIQAFIDTAPPMSEVKRAKLARLLGTDHCRYEPGD